MANAKNIFNTDGDGLLVGSPSDGVGFVTAFDSLNTADLSVFATLSGAATGCGNNSGFGEHLANVGNVDGVVTDDVIVSAPSCGVGGKAFLYQSAIISSVRQLVLTTWTFDAGVAAAALGPVAAAGDVNRDGFADFVLGAPAYDAGSGSNHGAAWLFAGSTSPGNLPPLTSLTFLSGASGSRYGSSVSGGRDVNRDGFMDVLVGSPNFSDDVNTPNEGRIYLHPGTPLGLGSSLHRSSGDCANCLVGASVALGQVNETTAFADFYGDGVWGQPGSPENVTVRPPSS